MAKRSNPFIDDYIPQSKVHFGIRQFNNNEEGLKKVYEKTLQMLFKGAKKNVIPEAQDSPVTLSKDKKKQLFIGKDGTLLYSGTMVHATNVTVKKCDCGSCVVQQCAYCEKAVCDQCRLHCRCCDQLYCSQCSLIRYEGSEVCVSCYS